MPKLAKFTVKYVVLHQGEKTYDNGYESTYFATHGAAFMYCEGLDATARAVYVVKGRDPLTLQPVNVWGGREFHGARCPVFQMQQHFMTPAHNINFIV